MALPKKNYLAWEIKAKDFYALEKIEDKLRFLVRFAVLAPSLYNTQPWRFEIRGAEIFVYPDFARALPIADGNHRQIYISLGCAIENMLVAADYFGLRLHMVHFPTGLEGAVTKLILQGSVTAASDPTHLMFQIEKRVTNRSRYASTLPPETFFARMRALREPGIRIDVIQDERRRHMVADVASQAMHIGMNDARFREEMAHYVKNNLTASPIGMPGFGMGDTLLPSFAMPALLKKFNMNRFTKAREEVLLKNYTPLMGVISGELDDPPHWVRAGQLYERAALLACHEELKTHIMVPVIQVGDFHEALARVVGISGRPQVFFRMGYTETVTPHSPRLEAREVIS